MMNPKNIGTTIRMFIQMGSKEIVEQFLENCDLAAEGSDFLAVSN
jgi:hypothetical protein